MWIFNRKPRKYVLLRGSIGMHNKFYPNEEGGHIVAFEVKMETELALRVYLPFYGVYGDRWLLKKAPAIIEVYVR